MNKTDLDVCRHSKIPVTIKGLTNAQSYCVVDYYSEGHSFIARLLPCHVDYHGKAVGENRDEVIATNIYDLNMIRIEDYNNY